MSMYADQPIWREIQSFLPERYRIPLSEEPSESFWDWHGDRIHIDAYRNPNASVKVILMHGVGTNGRQMMTILGRPLAQRGYETIAADMPGYGLTEVGEGHVVTYDDWVQCGSDLIDRELARDSRPIVLYGLSAGGMLTYNVASRNRKVKGIAGMTFLDNRDRRVRDETAKNLIVSRVGAPLMSKLASTPLAKMKMPMSQAGKMSALCNSDAAMKVFMRDKTSAANAVSIAFLDSYMSHVPEVEPADFNVCPVLLTQPADDRWTPLELSEPVIGRIGKVPVRTIMLENAGHYPIEEPGLSQMVDAIDDFFREVTGTEKVR